MESVYCKCRIVNPLDQIIHCKTFWLVTCSQKGTLYDDRMISILWIFSSFFSVWGKFWSLCWTPEGILLVQRFYSSISYLHQYSWSQRKIQATSRQLRHRPFHFWTQPRGWIPVAYLHHEDEQGSVSKITIFFLQYKYFLYAHCMFVYGCMHGCT